MKTRSFLTLCLLTVLLLVSCAPVESPAPALTEATAAPMTEEPQALPTAVPTLTEALVMETEIPPTEAPTDIPQPVATSRGPDLEATDPTSVRLDSGELQLVEFFRFT